MIIGLHGALQSGKDTAYNLIEQEFGHERKVLRRAFADPLKVSAARSFGFEGTDEEAVAWCNALKESGQVRWDWDGTSANGYLIPKSTTISGRQFFQYYGTEGHRNVFGTDFWVDASLPRYDGMGHSESGIFGIDHKEDLLFFTDVRFPTARDRIREWGGVVWRIRRPGTGGDGHASEQVLDGCDLVIDNDGTLDDFRSVLAFHVDSLLGLVAR